MKSVDAPSAWNSPSDLDKKEFDGRDPPQGVAPHTDVVGAPVSACKTNVTNDGVVFSNIVVDSGPRLCDFNNYRR